jgi:hypothetical protein
VFSEGKNMKGGKKKSGLYFEAVSIAPSAANQDCARKVVGDDEKWPMPRRVANLRRRLANLKLYPLEPKFLWEKKGDGELFSALSPLFRRFSQTFRYIRMLCDIGKLPKCHLPEERDEFDVEKKRRIHFFISLNLIKH